MRRRFVLLVLIAGFITLHSGVAFTQTNQVPVPTRTAQAPEVQPNLQTIQLNRQALPLPAANGQPVSTPATASDRLNAPDPLAPLNRKVLNVNVKADRVAFHPLAGGWAKIVPKPARRCLVRFFDNVKFIPRFTNDMLQLKLRDAGGEVARFGINSTIGAAGLFDPAGEWFGINEHDNDFGTTLKTWGMSDVLFVEMPVGGPVNVRETLGHFVDGAMNPLNYVVPAGGEVYESIAHSIEGLNKRAENLDKFEGVRLESDRLGSATHDTNSLYETVRANYLQAQRRNTGDNDTGAGPTRSVAGPP